MKPEEPPTTSKALSDITHLNSGGLKIPSSGLPAWEMSSVSENKLEEIMADPATTAQLITQLNNMLLRVYPGGTRVDSSNYDVQYGWLGAGQIVALNYQTPDQPMVINKCFFENNGRSGYVLKPNEMLDGSYSLTKEISSKMILNLTVISGNQLPQVSLISDSVNPSVSFSLIGLGTDSKTFQTETIYDNGFNPQWKQNQFKFALGYPQHAVLLIKVKESEGNSTSCYNCLLVSNLRFGFRTIPLKSSKTNEILPHSWLLVYISTSMPRKF